ncbi:MAG: sporulation integral membrane protein YtvI [Clostridia bacterium]|nr:sporulation integral membrane protein YtvI [Clostridia bacterium]
MKFKSMLPKEPYKKILVIAAYVLIGAALAFVFVKYLASVLLPFIIAYVLAVLLHPLVNLVCKKTKIPRVITVIFTVVITVGVVGALLYLVVHRVYNEITSLYQTVSNILTEMKNNPDYAVEIIDTINGYVPFVDFREQLMEIWENIDIYVTSFATTLVTDLNGVIIPAINAIMNTVPPVLVGTIITIVAFYYFLAQYHRINNAVVSVFPKVVGEHLVAIKRQLVNAVFMFIKAYGVIMMITFMEAFVGFTILGIKYAFLMAVLTAIVDIMPILGTGAVVIPWGIFEIIRGNYFVGIGLLVLYAIITVVRQFLEPKIVGKSVGLHPLLALVSMYVGLKLLGVVGLFGFPIALVIYNRLSNEGFFKFKSQASAPAPAPPQETVNTDK